MGRGALQHKDMEDLDLFLKQAQELLPELPQTPAEHRAYFDHEGKLLFYSMEDLPGNYVVVDQDTWARGDLNIKLKDGHLIWITAPASSKLVPAMQGVSCDARDVTVIAWQEPCQKWIKRDYDQDC